jgi:predicted N-acetyltransferase YhbS
LAEVWACDVHVRPATRADAPAIVRVSNSSIRPGEDVGFGGGLDSPFHDASVLAAVWRDPNIVRGEEVLVAEMDGRIVGCATIEDRGDELELVNIDVPLRLQGRGVGTILVRSVEERAKAEGKQAVTAGTSRNAEGVAWKSLPWWQHLGYRVTHEEENAWTRSIGPGAREIRLRKELPTESDPRG